MGSHTLLAAVALAALALTERDLAAATDGLSGRLDVFEGRLATAGPLHLGVGDGPRAA